MSLTAAQRQAFQRIHAITGSTQSEPVLLHGCRGSGKRTVCSALAAEIGLDILPVDVSRSSNQLMRDLELALDDMGSDAAVVMLDNLDRMDQGNAGLIQALCRNRRVGAHTSLAPESPVVGLHHTRSRPREIGLSHPALTPFRARIEVEPLVTVDDLLSILTAHCTELDVPGLKEKVEALTLMPILKTAQDTVSFARDVAALYTRGGTTTELVLRESCRRSWDRWLSQLRYKGTELTYSRFESWLGQFPSETHAALTRIAEATVDSYYVDESEYWELVEVLARQTGIPAWENVLFCRWQDQGESAPEVARDLKGWAKWNVAGELDLDQPGTWAGLDPDAPALMVDDFVGSGAQLTQGLQRLMTAAAAMPGRQFVVALLSGFENGLASAVGNLDPLPQNVRVARARSYQSRDSCLSEDSCILTAASDRASLRDISESLGGRLNIRASRRLGWGELAALVVFPRFLPNADLPLLWFDASETYSPLIPRSGWQQ